MVAPGRELPSLAFLLDMTATDKVCYAISTGEYSDYRVVAVFSSKKKAEAILHLFPGASIEGFPLDPELPEASAGRLPFLCCSHHWDRKARQVVPGTYAHANNHEDVMSNGQQVYCSGSMVNLTSSAKHAELSTYVWAKDENHAIKIAAERFAHYQAIQAGIAC
jgi:hypothetical protein